MNIKNKPGKISEGDSCFNSESSSIRLMVDRWIEVSHGTEELPGSSVRII